VVIDTSALIAILNNEPESRSLQAAMASAAEVRISAATLVEAAIVADNRRDPIPGRGLDDLLRRTGTVVEPVTAEQASTARTAHRDFGRGSGHPARLNFGDCFAYALAKVLDEPLLYKGDDFGHTDVRSALGH
jgi:ribonuclease VapC